MKRFVFLAAILAAACCSCSKQNLEPVVAPEEVTVQSYSIGLDIIAPEDLESSSVTFYDSDGNSLSSRILEGEALRNGEMSISFRSKKDPAYLISPDGEGIVPIPVEAVTKASIPRVTLILHKR